MPSVEHQASSDVESSEKEGQEWTVSRRRLLKVLAAAGGAVAASTLLPDKWARPVVEVGMLPAHAQVTPGVATPTPTPTRTPEPTYSAVCDSTPGGGDITSYHNLPSGSGRIEDIRPVLIITSGTGSVENITVTMTAEAVAPSSSLPSFSPMLPRFAITDANGVADFGALDVTGTPIQYFNLIFNFAIPTGGPLDTTCGIYELH